MDLTTLDPLLRQACESCMFYTTDRDLSTRLRSISLRLLLLPRVPEEFVEFVLLPALLAVPGDPERNQAVGEIVRDAGLEVVAKVLERFDCLKRRKDVVGRTMACALATLTGGDGKLNGMLNEETKFRALRVLGLLFGEYEGDFGDGDSAFHAAALCLDLAGMGEKAKSVRELALGVLRKIVRAVRAIMVGDMFPGASSALCELSRPNLKSGSEVTALALECLTDLCRIVLAAPLEVETIPVESRELKNSITSRLREAARQNSPPLQPTEANNYFTRFIPMVLLALKSDDDGGGFAGANDDDSMARSPRIRTARAQLAGILLSECSQIFPAREESSKASLLRVIVASAAANDADSEEAQIARLFFNRLTVAEFNPILVLQERLLGDSLIKLCEPSRRDDAFALQTTFNSCKFLIAQMGEVRVRGVFDASLNRIVDSLILTFECQSSRFDQFGCIEFQRLADPATMAASMAFFQTLREQCPRTSEIVCDAMFDRVAFSSQDEEASDSGGFDDDMLPRTMTPKSHFPQCLYLASLTTTNPATLLQKLLLDLEQVWELETSQTFISIRKRKAIKITIPPQVARLHALIRASALVCMCRCADRMGGSKFRLYLVNALFPVLLCLGDERSGLKLAASMCLDDIARICEYHGGSSDLLEQNVDYVVDGLVSKLPQLSKHDTRFCRVLEALIERIPVWDLLGETSPWIRDLIQALLDGLDDRAFSAQVSWSLLRVAEVVVGKRPIGVRLDRLGDVSSLVVADEHDAIVEKVLSELNEWDGSTARGGKMEAQEQVLGEVQEDEGQQEGYEREADKPHKTASALAIESLLTRSANFFSDEDILVRRQAILVASHCVNALGDPTRARQLVHEIWPSLVDQLREERHPDSVSLLLKSLTMAAIDAGGEDFLVSKFSEQAWPVLENLLYRAHARKIKRHVVSSRDKEIAKRVLAGLHCLGNALLGSRAERIAKASAFFIDADVENDQDAQLHTLAIEVWKALAKIRSAGDVLWLAVVDANVVNLDLMKRCSLRICNRRSAQIIMDVLNAQ